MTCGPSLPGTLALAFAAVIYIVAWFRLRRTFPGMIPTTRVAAFLGGLFAVWVAVASPLVSLDHQLLTIHMAKHLLLMTAASPLILLGMPAPAVPLARPFSGSVLRTTGRTLSHPVLCWSAAAITVIGWHVPAMFQLALESHAWHDVELASFLAAGLLFWWPVVRPWPGDAESEKLTVPVYLFLATLPCDILSAFLVFCGHVVYPCYLQAPRIFDLSPQQDQELAGAIMWVSVTLIYGIPATIIMTSILSPRIEHAAERI